MIVPWMPRSHLIIGILSVFLLLEACSRSQTNADRNRASQPANDLVITHGIFYGPETRNSLDIYALRAPGPPRPIVIFFYGGGYDSGAKADFAWVGMALARRGYVAIVPDFRLYPQALWPTFLEDCAASVRWAHDHAAAYGGNSSNLLLMGHSSGAYNAVSLAVDRRWLARVSMDPRRDLLAVVGISGPYDDLPTTNTKLQTIFGANWRDTQPISHADGHSPPLMLITGDRDDVVDPQESDRMAIKVRANGGTAMLVHYPLLGHGGTLESFLPPRGKKSQVLDDVTSFIRAEIAVAKH